MVRCKTCWYYSFKTYTCDYILRHYHSRGCPVDGCTRYKPSRMAKQITGERLPDDKAEFLRLYEAGLTDYEIAAVMGRPRSTIQYWRAKLGLPAQKSLREEIEDDA